MGERLASREQRHILKHKIVAGVATLAIGLTACSNKETVSHQAPEAAPTTVTSPIIETPRQPRKEPPLPLLEDNEAKYFIDSTDHILSTRYGYVTDDRAVNCDQPIKYVSSEDNKTYNASWTTEAFPLAIQIDSPRANSPSFGIADIMFGPDIFFDKALEIRRDEDSDSFKVFETSFRLSGTDDSSVYDQEFVSKEIDTFALSDAAKGIDYRRWGFVLHIGVGTEADWYDIVGNSPSLKSDDNKEMLIAQLYCKNPTPPHAPEKAKTALT